MEIFGVSHWSDGVAIIEIRKPVGKAAFLRGEGGDQEFSSGYIKTVNSSLSLNIYQFLLVF